MKFDKHGNGNGMDDLYVLPESKAERDAIILFLHSIGRSFSMKHSTVDGQDWYGKTFIEIHFGEHLQTAIAGLYIDGEETT